MKTNTNTSAPWRPRTAKAAGLWLTLTLTLLISTPRLVLAQATPGFEEISNDAMLGLAQDFDFDGILDGRERFLGTDPASPDTDGDGFSDLFEDQYQEFGFDPLVPSRDSDQDGLEDQLEIAADISPESPDTDRDGLSDFDETMNAQFGYDPRVPSFDSDFDGLTDSFEERLKTSPHNSDSDQDGASDFEEVQAGLDPRIPQEGGFGESIGRTYSDAMAEALIRMRKGEAFPVELAGELPYPAVTRRFLSDPRRAGIQPDLSLSVSAALIQSAVFQDLLNPYRTYNNIVGQLKDIAEAFDGNPQPKIVRLFRWSQPTAQGRDVYALKISDNPNWNENEREVLFMGVHHARELITSSITLGWIRKLTDGYAAGDPAIQDLVNHSEIWIIPLLNPDGYSRALSEHNSGANANWRKNLRKIGEFDYPLGVDLNRNYGFEHVSSLTLAERAALEDYSSNGLFDDGSFNQESFQFPYYFPFSEVETRSVRGLVNNSFLTGSEVAGIQCSLSWHSYGGEVIHPMGHETVNGLIEADRPKFDQITDAFANATGYANTKDTWPALHYDVYGDSDDWLYKEKGIFAITVESYSYSERGGVGPSFYPTSASKRDVVVNNNIQGAMAFVNACCEPGGTFVMLDPKVLKKLFQVSFQSDAGARYVVEFSNSPQGPDWRTLTETIGTGEMILIEDPIPDDVTARFYRVRQD